jgi:hypothetical protein
MSPITDPFMGLRAPPPSSMHHGEAEFACLLLSFLYSDMLEDGEDDGLQGIEQNDCNAYPTG